MYKHLNTKEWLESEHLDGNEFAIELLELVDGEDDAIAAAEALNELYNITKLKSDGKLHRLVEYINDRLRLLETIEALISWYNTRRYARNFTTRFSDAVSGSNRNRPHHKETSQPSDWYSLAMMLDAGLCLAARGEAFEPLKP